LQQNGVAERANQIIEFMACAMLVDSGLTFWFWPLSAHTATHIKNCVPHSSLDSKLTPFEGWFKHKPDLSHLRPFGVLVTARKTNSDQLTKIAPQGEEGCFVRYAHDARGYLVWFPDSKIICPHWDVKFHGFPVSLPSPPISDILWDDIPMDVEPHFCDNENCIILEQDSTPAIKHNEYVNILLLSCQVHLFNQDWHWHGLSCLWAYPCQWA